MFFHKSQLFKNYSLLLKAPVVHKQQYTRFRLTGVAFEMRMNSYYTPNRSLSSYIPGRTKTEKDSCLVRGFWGDITNSPYIGFGVELNNQEEHDIFYQHQDINYKFNSQHITEWNLSRYITRIEKDQLYELKFTQHKVREKAKDEADKDNKDTNSPEDVSEEAIFKDKTDQQTGESIADKDKSTQINNAAQDDVLNKEINLDKIKIHDSDKQTANFQEENSDNKALLGFDYFDMKIILLTGEIEQLFKKKK